jgi:hypothetical protein
MNFTKKKCRACKIGHLVFEFLIRGRNSRLSKPIWMCFEEKYHVF